MIRNSLAYMWGGSILMSEDNLSIKLSLREAYDNHADLGDSAQLEDWKAEERDKVLEGIPIE